MLELALFGRFEVRLGGALVSLPSRPAQSLLAYLALNAGVPHRREKLAGLLWPEADEDNARSNLRHALWRIRKVIESDHGAPPYLLTGEFAIAFDPAAEYRLDAALLTREGGSLQDRLDSLAVYRGELLPGFYEDWVTLERERLEALFQHKMQRLLDELVAERRWPAVLDWGERWVALGHAPEPGYRALMLAHAEFGNQSAVATIYQRCREALFNDLGVEPSASTRQLYERLRQGSGDSAAAVEARSPAMTSAGNEPPAPGDPPFQGLPYFDVADMERFFGRERLTARLVERLRTEPFVAVLGASGSGKSSAVRAGLVPALKRMRAQGELNGIRATRPTSDVRVLTPTAYPLEALVNSLLPQEPGGGHPGEPPYAPGSPETERAVLLEDLGRDQSGLQRFLTHRFGNGQGVVLVVDQFEELFTLCREGFEREAFIENLLAAADSDGATRVVVVLRADFYGHCADHAGLRQAVAQHQEYVGPLSVAEQRQAIEGPVEHGGWELEAGLVDLLLRDVGEEPGALPLLSHALLETWHGRQGRRLTLSGYAAAGGVRGAIAQTAEVVFAERLTHSQQAIARRLFVRLTELGDGTQDTRRRAAIDELVGRPGSEAQVLSVLQVLADARLVTLGESSAEVAHEALIREWPRLREWLSQDRERIRTDRQLAGAALDWERMGRDPGSLYRGARLARLVEWPGEYLDDLGSLERAFLDASRQEAKREADERDELQVRELNAARELAEAERRRADQQRRTARQLRERAVLLALAFAVALVMAGTAAFFGDTARQQASRAEANARTAVSRELAAAALTNLSIDPERAALLALSALEATYVVDRSWTPEAEDALHRVSPLLRTQLTLVGHTGEVLAVAFSPDGGQVATASRDGTARLWDALTGKEQLTLGGHGDSVNAVAFSPNGRLVATAGDDRLARLWDASNGQERLTLSGHTREVKRLAFSPDGTQLATSSLDGGVSLWDVSSGSRVMTFLPDVAGEVAQPIDVAFRFDGQRLATVSPGGDVREWDLQRQPPRLIHNWLAPSETLFTPEPRVTFSPEGTRLTTTTDTGAQSWWVGTGEPALRIIGHTNNVLHGAYSPDGTRFATASLDRTSKLWDSESGRELLTLAGHQAAVNQVAFSPDGQRLATASSDSTAKIWDLGPAHELLTIPAAGTVGWWPGRADTPQAGQVAVSQDGGWVMSGLEDGTARVWDITTGEERWVLRGNRSQVWGTAISADGTRLATGGSDRSVRVWDASTGAELWTRSAHKYRVVAVAFSPDGTRVASASQDQTARIWDAVTGQELLVLADHANPLTGVTFSPDGRHVVTATEGSENTVRMWDADSGKLLQTFAGHYDTVWSAAFSVDGTRLVTAGHDGLVMMWDTTNGQPMLSLRGQTGAVASAVFSPDGERIATGSRDGTIKLWDSAGGRERLTLLGADAQEGVDSVVFSPDGRQLIVRGDHAVRVYAISIDALAAGVQARLTRSWTAEECRRFLHLEECPKNM